MLGIQNSSPGHMVGTVITSDPLDPTLYLGSAVNNDTGLIWTDYHVNVYMAVPFTFVGTPTVDNPPGDTPPTDNWFVSGVVAPAWNGSQYEGTINFLGGTPLEIGDELDFNYAIHFSSSLDYSFTQQMIPSGYAVPEPGTLTFVAAGGLMLALRLRRGLRA